jgi:glutaminyl-peptide cyclotransferase
MGSGGRSLFLCILAVLALGPAGAPAWAEPPAFDGERALVLAHKMCTFGPRIPGTTAHGRTLDWLEKQLAAHADEVVRETFPAPAGSPYPRGTRLVNLIARFAPAKQPRVLLGAHWDSRPWADEDPDSTRWEDPVLGANDAASACAVLLHLAELMSGSEPPVGVDLVLFDGEDGGRKGEPQSYCLGSQEHVRRLGGRKPAYAIILDMVGSADLILPVEAYSMQRSPDLVRLVWERAARLGHREFVLEVEGAIFDDHLPFLQAGIPAVDVIDPRYPEWHTVRDTPERLSARSLGIVGEVITSVVFEP